MITLQEAILYGRVVFIGVGFFRGSRRRDVLFACISGILCRTYPDGNRSGVDGWSNLRGLNKRAVVLGAGTRSFHERIGCDENWGG